MVGVLDGILGRALARPHELGRRGGGFTAFMTLYR